MGLTPRAKRVIELAIDEARRLDHHYVGTEHLLLGLVREGEGIAAGVLESLGVDLDKVRHEVIRVLAQPRDRTSQRSIGRPAPACVASRRSTYGVPHVSSGSPFEATIGFSRAVRSGDRVLISGTAPIWSDGSVDPDVAVQTRRCFEIILAALAEAGGEPRHVIRTRMFIVDAADGTAVGQVHGEIFGRHPPGRHDGGRGRPAGPALEGGDRGGGAPRQLTRPARQPSRAALRRRPNQ